MTLPGETVNKRTVACDCGERLKLDVYRSAAGHYIGFFCYRCGPYSRESGYYPTYEAANAALKEDLYGRT